MPDIEEMRHCRGVVLPDELVTLRPRMFRTRENIKKEMLLLAVLLKGIDLYEREILRNRDLVRQYVKERKDTPDHDCFFNDETDAFLVEYCKFKPVRLTCYTSVPFLVEHMNGPRLSDSGAALERFEAKLGEEVATIGPVDPLLDGFSEIDWDD